MSSIPPKEIHPGAGSPSEWGLFSHGNSGPRKEDAYRAPNNPVTKNPAEMEPRSEWDGIPLKVGETVAPRDGSTRETQAGNVSVNDAKDNTQQTQREWENQEAQFGQGGKEVPAAKSR